MKFKTIKQLEKEIYLNEERAKARNIFRIEANKLKERLHQTKEIVKMIEEEKNKFAETEVSEYSEGYSSGWIKACEGILIKIKGEEK